jgi:hypothetical protein
VVLNYTYTALKFLNGLQDPLERKSFEQISATIFRKNLKDIWVLGGFNYNYNSVA